MILLVTCLVAQAITASGPCDSDPNHLWNRIHTAIHEWAVRDVDPQPGEESLHWPADPSDLAERSQLSLSKLLEEVLAKRGEELTRDPTKRAVLLRDLWMIFDWSLSTEQRTECWDPATGKELAARSGHLGILTALEFSGDGKLLVTAGYDGTGLERERKEAKAALERLAARSK